MGKVIQQRHIAAMVLGKFIHKGEITIFHCHDHKNGEEALLFCVSERDVPAVNLPALYLIIVLGS
jgi:hypothetical protein